MDDEKINIASGEVAASVAAAATAAQAGAAEAGATVGASTAGVGTVAPAAGGVQPPPQGPRQLAGQPSPHATEAAAADAAPEP